MLDRPTFHSFIICFFVAYLRSTLREMNCPTIQPFACAGIDLHDFMRSPLHHGLPRMRGDRPFLFDFVKNPFLFTPHARGSTS